jgi:dipeptidase D
MTKLSNLEPKNVFKYFEEISAVPRGSGHTDKISNYCVNFAKEHNFRYICEDIGNIIIFKEGTSGRENEEPVILQGHLDMVWEKEEGSTFDFENTGIDLLIEGDYLTANGTTLGGDDGIAIAICLAILDSNSISHPPLEVVFTVNEETGMDGARAIDASVLKGKRMINLDSESESILWVSCAGGARADIALNLSREKNDVKTYEIQISGLHGGHSGSEIHKGYANASVLMGSLLNKISQNGEIYISNITGGKMDNAITREATSTICVNFDIAEIINDFAAEILEEYKISDPNIKTKYECTKAENRFDKKSSDTLASILSSLPYGVRSMSEEIEGLVQTSLNPGILETKENTVRIGYSVRSSVNQEKENLIDELKTLAKSHGAEIEIYGEYPAWEYKKESPLRDIMSKIYREKFGKELEITAIHAGLECGIFNGKIDSLDCVSIGPDMMDIHTPKEKLSISSSKRIYEFVVETLEKM